MFGGFRLCTVVSCITNLTVIILIIEKILIILMIPKILIITIILTILLILIILTILLILIILTIHGSTCSTYFWCPEHLCTASSKLRSLHPPWKDKDENLIFFFYFIKLTLDSGHGSLPQFHLEQKSRIEEQKNQIRAENVTIIREAPKNMVPGAWSSLNQNFLKEFRIQYLLQ